MRWLRRTFLAVAISWALLAVALPASAGFNVCNESGLVAHTAVGYWDNTGYVTEGWWSIDPNTCVVVYEEPLQWQWYYAYAESDVDENGDYTLWDGQTMLCVGELPDRFKILDSVDCGTGFFEINTGTSINWTHRLK